VLIKQGAESVWRAKKTNDQYDQRSGTDSDSPKARMARTMDSYVENFDKVPALILPCLVRYREPTPM